MVKDTAEEKFKTKISKKYKDNLQTRTKGHGLASIDGTLVVDRYA